MLEPRSPGPSQSSRQSVRLGAKIVLALALLAACPELASANVIQFPDDELASESVLPKFDDPQSVKLRTVTTAGKFEIGPIGGYSLVEAFFQPYSYGLNATFHFNEEHGFNLIFLNFLGGVSSYSNQLNPIPGSPTNANFNGQYAPPPKYLGLASWQYTAYYGKMSVTRDTIFNLSLYGLLGAGGYEIGDALEPTLAVGFGQKIYFTPNFALRADLRLLMYQGPDITSTSLSNATSIQPSSSFTQKILFGNLLTVGATYFFGG